jgi:hypothetical protein
MTSKKNGRQPQNNKKMEDDLKITKKNGRQPQQNNGRRTNQPKST